MPKSCGFISILEKENDLLVLVVASGK